MPEPAMGWILVSMVLIASEGPKTEIPTGFSKSEVSWAGKSLELFTYRPEGGLDPSAPLILVFHGVMRNADEYCEWAQPIARTLKTVVAAPCFSRADFPGTVYQQGNLISSSGKLVPRSDWTWSSVDFLVADLRKQLNRPKAPFRLIGHSAGGQFLVRMAGFCETEAQCLVAGNPGTQLFPTRDLDYPLGFGGLPEELSNDEALRRYLAKPLTFFLGSADLIQDRNFDKSEKAMKQGANRFERGKNAFAMGEALAKSKGWPFGWRLAIAPKINHSAEKMLAHPVCIEALSRP